MTSKVGFHKIFLTRVSPSDPSLNLITGDVNAVHTLGCAPRRHLLFARALNERSPLIRELPFPRTKTIGDVYIDDLVIPSVLQFSDAHVASSPTEVQRTRRRVQGTRIPSRTASLAHAHHDAGRFYTGKSDTPPTPSRRVGFRPRVPARSIRLPRRGLHCSRDSGSKQTMSSDWGSVRRASPFSQGAPFCWRQA